MPAKDIYHDTVKRALIKDGWTIISENLYFEWGPSDLYIDIGAEKLFAAEKDGRKIAVEVKSFAGKSEMSDLEKALGQFFLYRYVLQRDQPGWEIFLAIRQTVYNRLFLTPDGVAFAAQEAVKFVVFDEVKEEVVRWIN